MLADLPQGRYDSPIPNSGGQFCTKIAFISGDAVNGPLHTNDALGSAARRPSAAPARTRSRSAPPSPGFPGFIGVVLDLQPLASPTFTGTS